MLKHILKGNIVQKGGNSILPILGGGGVIIIIIIIIVMVMNTESTNIVTTNIALTCQDFNCDDSTNSLSDDPGSITCLSNPCTAEECCTTPNIDCVGNWSPCTSECTKTFTVTTPSSGDGLDCETPLPNTLIEVWHANNDGCYSIFQMCVHCCYS